MVWPIPSRHCQATEYYSNATEQNNWSAFHLQWNFLLQQQSCVYRTPVTMIFTPESNHQYILQSEHTSHVLWLPQQATRYRRFHCRKGWLFLLSSPYLSLTSPKSNYGPGSLSMCTAYERVLGPIWPKRTAISTIFIWRSSKPRSVSVAWSSCRPWILII